VVDDPAAPDAETIPALLAHRGRHEPEIRALVDDDGTVTYAELDEASAALAARLVALGVVKGDRLGLLAPNGICWAVTAYAALRVGAVLVPFSTLLRPPELLAQMRTAQVTHLVVAPGFRGRDHLADLDEAAPGLRAAVDATGDGGGRHAAAPGLPRTIGTVAARLEPRIRRPAL
jgi:acyl-CoA synthetase (AMP-forming)/AMP-acid ligase II